MKKTDNKRVTVSVFVPPNTKNEFYEICKKKYNLYPTAVLRMFIEETVKNGEIFLPAIMNIAKTEKGK